MGKAIKKGTVVKARQCVGSKVKVKAYRVPSHVRCKTTKKFTPKAAAKKKKKIVKLDTMKDLRKVTEKPKKGVTYQISKKLSDEAYKQVGKSTRLEDTIASLEKRYGSAPDIPAPAVRAPVVQGPVNVLTPRKKPKKRIAPVLISS